MSHRISLEEMETYLQDAAIPMASAPTSRRNVRKYLEVRIEGQVLKYIVLTRIVGEGSRLAADFQTIHKSQELVAAVQVYNDIP